SEAHGLRRDVMYIKIVAEQYSFQKGTNIVLFKELEAAGYFHDPKTSVKKRGYRFHDVPLPPHLTYGVVYPVIDVTKPLKISPAHKELYKDVYPTNHPIWTVWEKPVANAKKPGDRFHHVPLPAHLTFGAVYPVNDVSKPWKISPAHDELYKNVYPANDPLWKMWE
ncbi:MAG: hypothetical protein SFY92_12400, partial [Verrucomicrobiae bacterium]|nr:hypothetical protein [Verrucomicrobiae bacterium]